MRPLQLFPLANLAASALFGAALLAAVPAYAQSGATGALGKGTGPIMTREELRACLKGQDDLNRRREQLQAESKWLDEEKAAIQAEARQIIAQKIVPAYAKLLAFYRNEYLPQARKTLAAEAMPDGKAFYQAQIREYTTTDLTPEQIHRIGLEEVARITADMEKTKEAAAREIAIAFGVPPMLIGIPGDATYANYQEANRAFYRLTVLPLATRVVATVSHWLAGFTGEAVELKPDLDQVPALAVERDQQWARVAAATFLTDAEKRALLGLPPLEGA